MSPTNSKLSQAVTVVATIKCPTEYSCFIKQMLERTVSRVQDEPGCESYMLYQDVSDNQKFVMLERWTSKAHLDQHTHKAPFKELLTQLEGRATLSVVILHNVS